MRGNRAFVVIGVLLCLLLAGVVSSFASDSPDGLNKVAQQQQLATAASGNRAPMAGYEASSGSDDPLSRGVAGIVGSVVVLVTAGCLTVALRDRARGQA